MPWASGGAECSPRIASGLSPPCRSAEQFLRLWRNEVLRVFHDRLINSDDKLMVCNRLAELVEQKFPTCAQHTLVDPILFGDFRCVCAGVRVCCCACCCLPASPCAGRQGMRVLPLRVNSGAPER